MGGRVWGREDGREKCKEVSRAAGAGGLVVDQVLGILCSTVEPDSAVGSVTAIIASESAQRGKIADTTRGYSGGLVERLS